MAYTTIDDPSAFFQVMLHAEDDTAFTFDGNSDLQPDMIWNKNRDEANYDHHIVDSVRGVSKVLRLNTIAEFTSADSITAIGSDGFTTGADNNGYVSSGTDKQVSWCWKAGTSFSNDASSTSVGTIDSAGSISTTAGFSIITWTGSGSAATIAHGLGAKLGMYIVKNRSDADEDWVTYHGKNTSAPQTDYVMLNQNNATGDSAGVWNDTAPTSTVFSVGTANSTNGSSKNMIAYCFAEKQGYSKFGSYIGNGNADGTFIPLSFAPTFVMVKRAVGGTGHWMMLDNKRSASGGSNVLGERIKANANDAGSTNAYMDFLSNGFKLRNTAASWNANGSTYIFMAFAENPFVTSTGIPATAR